MAKLARIHCINKTNRMNPHERIENVGGVDSDGSQWKQSIGQTIKDIESGEWEFYVEEDGIIAGLIVATHDGHKYIKTTADDIQPDDLLSLAECP
ncbi:DUF3892 domain-containing protein [Bradyrhizobium sp. DOA1]|uniref:DUF3892 domain-containing protein n=1 Tax=Bradyrhizobium sp. DOA1 TaxID=1126616 RepID=UPI00077C9259|nr:DUF3892 domain-containing protein [Bradyrhizobium sp. DOA1]KYH01492.1 hypothetical protein SE91_25855 [Bradyrhizobium sp. DOA1]